jgi:hypothetical protein
MPMPPGFPKSGDFPAGQVTEHTASWHYRRDPGQGGSNFGTDFLAPNDAVVVDYEIHVSSEHDTDGSANIRLVMKSTGVLQMPIGVHVGHRLEPGDIFGPGATYKGEVKMKIVSPQAWLTKVISGLPR